MELDLLRSYYIKQKPSYWLFERPSGGKYSAKSVQNIYRSAQQKSGASPCRYSSHLAPFVRHI